MGQKVYKNAKTTFKNSLKFWTSPAFENKKNYYKFYTILVCPVTLFIRRLFIIIGIKTESVIERSRFRPTLYLIDAHISPLLSTAIILYY